MSEYMSLIHIRYTSGQSTSVAKAVKGLHEFLKAIDASPLVKSYMVDNAIYTIAPELGLKKWARANYVVHQTEPDFYYPEEPCSKK